MSEQLPKEKMDQPACCECCGYPSKFLTRYEHLHGDRMNPNGGTCWYCGLCAGTETSSTSRYPSLHTPDVIRNMKTMCYIGNAIIDAIREKSQS